MGNRKLKMYIGIVILILIVGAIGYLVYVNVNNNREQPNEISEYIPQEEFSDEQMRKTIVTLYFMDINTKELVEDPIQIDSKELLGNPYKTIVELLIKGPQDATKTKLIPEGAKLNKAEIKDNTVYLDFSESFIKEQKLGKKQEILIINSIVNSLTELTEVNSIIITIDGKKDLEFPDGGVNFKNPFTKVI